MKDLAIFITAFNRSKPFEALLISLKKTYTNKEIPLIISIDNNGSNEVNKLANEFHWPYGKKKVVIHDHKKGLVNHFIWVGNQTAHYNNIIFLEDDLLISPDLISFAEQIIKFYKNDPHVAAASLYNPVINELTGTKFYQINDGNDLYFIQHPYWGNIWFQKKWNQFSDYLNSYKENKALLPENIANWRESFKKIFIQYLIENELYVVVPRTSLITNQCVPGLHSLGGSSIFQTVIETNKYNYRLVKCKDSLVKYDAHFEIEPTILNQFNKQISKFEYDVDLNGTKKIYTKNYVLTSKPVKNNIMTFSSHFKPKELSIILNIENSDNRIKLCAKEDILEKKMFYLKRRYIDIINNYRLGIATPFFIVIDVFKKVFKHVFNKFINFKKFIYKIK